jgi:hypothetical protein
VNEAGGDGYSTPQHQSQREDFVGAEALDGHDPGNFEENIKYEEEGVDVSEFVALEFQLGAEAENNGIA